MSPWQEARGGPRAADLLACLLDGEPSSPFSRGPGLGVCAVSHAPLTPLTPLLDTFILSAKNTGLTGCPHPQHSFLTFSPAHPRTLRIVIDACIHPEQIVQRTPTLCQQAGLGCQGPPALPSGSNQQVACWQGHGNDTRV